jgi:hypothetical protein
MVRIEAHVFEVVVFTRNAQALLGIGHAAELGVLLPRKKSLNCAMPELVNIRVGSFLTTKGAEGTMWWPLDWKKSRNFRRISCEFIQKGIKVIFGNNRKRSSGKKPGNL